MGQHPRSKKRRKACKPGKVPKTNFVHKRNDWLKQNDWLKYTFPIEQVTIPTPDDDDLVGVPEDLVDSMVQRKKSAFSEDDQYNWYDLSYFPSQISAAAASAAISAEINAEIEGFEQELEQLVQLVSTELKKKKKIGV
jgi:hypothetical protein